MLSRVQRGLETLYRLDSELDVGHFLVDEAARDAAGVARSPREQLLLQEDEDGLCLGLFLAPELMESVRGCETAQLLTGALFGNFMMLVEGVSHFVYVAFKASANQNVSALELELQAEVDKYVTCLLAGEHTEQVSTRIRERLYKNIEYDDDLDEHEQERYRLANLKALRYSASLERRYVRSNKVSDMLCELRHFYRLSLPRKMAFIRQAA